MVKKNKDKYLDLIDFCISFFIQNGISATSTKMLADDFGLKKSSLYNYFDSKDDLILKCAQRYVDNAIYSIGFKEYIESIEGKCFVGTLLNEWPQAKSKKLSNLINNFFKKFELKNDQDFRYIYGNLNIDRFNTLK